ncbi:sensor histidine kinase [Mesobacillus maritimus]|uniref:sensor histidine kinase n=1 Tax=Mesobacillus maritimus TaxID=1643336 RepID=UPI00203A45C1|nr:sensor histidine kinase [Mesobacillus maritimus]MCM3584489.1 sensor histidine kinase [Mesobacillus maritimus]MCM3670778.1 sensor histidine kinase [Mesobacillus maritimus]
MLKQYWNLLKTTGISPYIWTILGILPFYFIFSQSSTTAEMVTGTILTLSFFLFFRFAFIAKSWTVYIWTIFLIAISIASTLTFSYVYFAFFIAYFIGQIHKQVPFFVLYFIHLVGMSAAINFELILNEGLFLRQLPFVIIVWISIILLPLSIRNKKVRGRLEEKLEDANKRIAELVKAEERQRIARDLHDTLGQKLSLIGLKSDLASRLIYKDPDQARSELKDVQRTARTALNEVRKMVSEMRGIRLKDEVHRVEQILKAAEIEFTFEAKMPVKFGSPFIENLISMCLKEAVTNVVKHSNASNCHITLEQSPKEITLSIQDDGIGGLTEKHFTKGSGLNGMSERLEFVNGSLEIVPENGAKLIVKVPKVIKQSEMEGTR